MSQIPTVSSSRSPNVPAPHSEPLAAAWKIVHFAAAALFVIQIVGAVESVVTAPPADRAGYALFSVGWLVLAGILTYGIWKRMRWATILGGVFAAIAIPVYLVTPFLSLEVQGETLRSSPSSTAVDLASAVACAVLLYGLWRLRAARRA